MIFDSDAVTSLVLEYQHTADEKVLEDIVVGSRRLVEAIVSTFDSTYRDDLIQESFIRIQKSLLYFDSDISTLHNYFTTVIRNICITYVNKQSKDIFVEDIDLHTHIVDPHGNGELVLEDYLPDLVARNRVRFPSIPTDDIDEMSEFIYYTIRDGVKSSKLVSIISKEFDIDRAIVSVVCNSTIIYIRQLHKSNVDNNLSKPDEFSLSYDLLEMVGESIYKEISTLFSGMYVRFL